MAKVELAAGFGVSRAAKPRIGPYVVPCKVAAGKFLWWTTYRTEMVESADWLLVEFPEALQWQQWALIHTGWDLKQSPVQLYRSVQISGREFQLPVHGTTPTGRERRDTTYWLWRDQVYEVRSREAVAGFTVRDTLNREEQKAKARIERESRRQARDLERELRELLPEADRPERRERIPDTVKMFVWRRDGGACVQCGVRSLLEYDHIIPVSMGGSNTARNLQLLCEDCNRQKGGNLV